MFRSSCMLTVSFRTKPPIACLRHFTLKWKNWWIAAINVNRVPSMRSKCLSFHTVPHCLNLR